MVQKVPQSFFKRFFQSRLFLIIAVFFITIVAYANIRSYYNNYKIKQEILSMQQELQGLQKKKLASVEVLKYVLSRDFVEEKARTDLNMKKPGEHVAIFSTNSAELSQKNIEVSDALQTRGNPIKWWYYFFGT